MFLAFLNIKNKCNQLHFIINSKTAFIKKVIVTVFSLSYYIFFVNIFIHAYKNILISVATTSSSLKLFFVNKLLYILSQIKHILKVDKLLFIHFNYTISFNYYRFKVELLIIFFYISIQVI